MSLRDGSQQNNKLKIDDYPVSSGRIDKLTEIWPKCKQDKTTDCHILHDHTSLTYIKDVEDEIELMVETGEVLVE